MSLITGTFPITGPVSPIDTEDTYPVIDPKWGIDGLRSVIDLATMYSIPTLRRRVGMIVYVNETNKYYRCLSTTGTSSAWEELNIVSSSSITGSTISGTSGTSGIDGTSGTSGISGTNGISGTSGTAGTSGSSGLSGTSGTSGTSGAVGNPGSNSLIYRFTSVGAIGDFFDDTSISQLIIGRRSRMGYSTSIYPTNNADGWLNNITPGSILQVYSVTDPSNYKIYRINSLFTVTTDLYYFNYTSINSYGSIASPSYVTISYVNNGSSGTSGSRGLPGDSGTSGTSGSSGISGSSGTSGLSGTSGTSGVSGTSGLNGTSGTSGTSGLSGTSGTSGLNGTSGTSGLNGTSGTSGLSGTSGTSGISGRDGQSTSIFSYKSDTSIITPPSTGKLQWNNTSQTISTVLHVSTIDNDGINISVLLSLLDTNQYIIIQNRSDATQYQKYIITGTPTNMSSYYDIPVGLISYGGIDFINNQDIIIAIYALNGTSGTSGLSGTSGTSGLSGTSGSSGTSGTSGVSGTSGLSGTSGSSGTSGVSGTSGLSGTSGTSGSSGINGSSGTSGLSGNDSANSGRWVYATTATSTKFSVNYTGSFSTITKIIINPTDMFGLDYTNWLNSAFILQNTHNLYIQVTKLGSSNVLAILKVTGAINTLGVVTFDVNYVSGYDLGIFNINDIYTISWVYSGTSGISGISDYSAYTGVTLSRNKLLFSGHTIPNVSIDFTQMLSTGVTYTNTSPTTTTIGGIPAGSTFNNRTMKQMWDALLYPYQVPAWTSFTTTPSTTTYEVGTTVNITSFSWNATNNTNINNGSVSIARTGAGTIISGLNYSATPYSYSDTLNNTTSTSVVYTLSGTYTNVTTSTITRTNTISWNFRRYYGVSSTSTTPTSGLITGLSSDLTTSLSGSLGFNPTSQYLYFAIASSYTQPTSFKVGGFNMALQGSGSDPFYNLVNPSGLYYGVLSITNINGITQTYNIYRSANALNSSTTVVIT